MEEKQSHQEDYEEFTEMNIKQFIEAARQYLFELAPAQPQLATATISKDR